MRESTTQALACLAFANVSATMEIKDTRLRALHMLLAEVGNKKAELVRRVKKSPVQISQWLSGYRRELSLAIAIDRRFRAR